MKPVEVEPAIMQSTEDDPYASVAPPPVVAPEIIVPKERHWIVRLIDSEEAEKAIRSMIRPGQSVARIKREFLNAVADNHKILDCDPASIIRALSRAVAWDLEIGDTCFLIPRKDKWNDPKPKLRPMMGYRGKIELLKRYGVARMVTARCVYAGETFIEHQGSNAGIEHQPLWKSDPERGKMIGAYAIAQVTQSQQVVVSMDITEIDEIRQAYSQGWRTRKESGIDVPIAMEEIPWYPKKTVVHQLGKVLPLSPQRRMLMQDDDDRGHVEMEEPEYRQLVAGEFTMTTTGSP